MKLAHCSKAVIFKWKTMQWNEGKINISILWKVEQIFQKSAS